MLASCPIANALPLLVEYILKRTSAREHLYSPAARYPGRYGLVTPAVGCFSCHNPRAWVKYNTDNGKEPAVPVTVLSARNLSFGTLQ